MSRECVTHHRCDCTAARITALEEALARIRAHCLTPTAPAAQVVYAVLGEIRQVLGESEPPDGVSLSDGW